MFFLLQHQHYISWFDSWCLVCFPRECDLLSVPHAFVHMHLQKLGLLTHLMTLTLSAAVLLVYNLTCASAHTDVGQFQRAVLLVIAYYLFLPVCGSVCGRCGHITLSVAVRADWLHLLDHPRGQLSNHDSHTSSSTCHTLLHCSCLTPLTRKQTVKCWHCFIYAQQNDCNYKPSAWALKVLINMLFFIITLKH